MKVMRFDSEFLRVASVIGNFVGSERTVDGQSNYLISGLKNEVVLWNRL